LKFDGGCPFLSRSCQNVICVNRLNGAIVRLCFGWVHHVPGRLGPKLGPWGLSQPANEQVVQIVFAGPQGWLGERYFDEPIDNSPSEPASSNTLLAWDGVHVAAMQEEASEVE
jgi:hypothetical protein